MSQDKTFEEVSELVQEILKEQRPKAVQFFNALYFDAVDKIGKKGFDNLGETMARVVMPYQIVMMNIFLKTSTLSFTANLGGAPLNDAARKELAEHNYIHVQTLMEGLLKEQSQDDFMPGKGLSTTPMDIPEEVWDNAKEV